MKFMNAIFVFEVMNNQREYLCAWELCKEHETPAKSVFRQIHKSILVKLINVSNATAMNSKISYHILLAASVLVREIFHCDLYWAVCAWELQRKELAELRSRIHKNAKTNLLQIQTQKRLDKKKTRINVENKGPVHCQQKRKPTRTFTKRESLCSYVL